MAAIVLVHGIAQEQCAADLLEKDWLPALAGGVRKAGFGDIADQLWRHSSVPGGIETRMAFYGNLFLRQDQQGDDPGDLTGEEQELAEELAKEWLERAANRTSSPNSNPQRRAKEREIAEAELAFVEGKIGREEAGAGRVVRKAMKSLIRLRWFAPLGMAFAERFVVKALSQVSRYLTDERIRKAALKAVLDLTGSDTKIIIGHSLGSVVAYEAVHMTNHLLPLFVTIGSPLGLDTVIYPKLRPQPPTYPGKVLRWVNLADTDDLVAAEPDLTKFFSGGIPSTARFEATHTVDNGTDPHNAAFYLSKAALGKPVGETLRGGIQTVG